MEVLARGELVAPAEGTGSAVTSNVVAAVLCIGLDRS
jgi:hypothetical protein